MLICFLKLVFDLPEYMYVDLLPETGTYLTYQSSFMLTCYLRLVFDQPEYVCMLTCYLKLVFDQTEYVCMLT